MSAAKLSHRFPLAPMQHGMLFHYMSAQQAGHEQSGIDIEQIIGNLDENIDITSFKQAWQETFNHQGAFRTRFIWEDIEEPVQEVLDNVNLPFDFYDLSTYQKNEQQQKLDKLVREDRQRGFNLHEAPLSRVTLIKLSETVYQLIWTFNHIILDGRSFAPVLTEVFARYEALLAGSSFVPAPSHSFGDHIQHLQKQDLTGSGARDFWQKRLKGFTAPNALPFAEISRLDLEAGEANQGEQELSLATQTTSALSAFCASHDITFNNIIQASWALLISRYTSDHDIVFGAVRAGRRSSVAHADDIVGHFINTVPIRIAIDREQTALSWLKTIRSEQRDIWRFEQTPLVDVQSWSEVSAGQRLFDSLLIYDDVQLNETLQKQGDKWLKRHFKLIEQTSFPLTLYAAMGTELDLRLVYDRKRFQDQNIVQILRQLETILTELSQSADKKISDISLISQEEMQKILHGWNMTRQDYPKETCAHTLFEQQCMRTPNAPALSFRHQTLTYKELNEKANKLAHHLTGLGIGPDKLVGICIERSFEMMIAILATLKAGGAYVPLDPAFPKDRIAYMIEDSGASVILTKTPQLELVAQNTQSMPDVHTPKIICMDRDWAEIAKNSDHNMVSTSKADNLAYMIYTSGSTGKPKGVMIEHRNVVNFFIGMDERLQHQPQNGKQLVWLAVTSISFDISVLELIYTLARGFQVVIYKEPERHDTRSGHLSNRTSALIQKMNFGLFYFASDEGEKTQNKYKLLLEGAKFADRNGFTSVSIPERHFHAFGGLYPNPSVAGAAIATITENVQIRSGSVVLPLHHPLRIAEEWSLVDNLSNGRVGLSFASGWQPVDFVLRPENFQDRHKIMYDGIEQLRKLWRGETLPFPDASGKMHDIGTLPRPIQKELPVWITTAGSPETWRSAGLIGANILTHLLGQTEEDIREKIILYKEARKEAGLDPEGGQITLMLHTFIGDCINEVRETVRAPMKAYLKSSFGLVKNVLSSWTAFKRRSDGSPNNGDMTDVGALSPQELDDLLDFSFERYFETSGLFGTAQSCLAMVDRLSHIGVTEIACLIDFGIESDLVLKHFKQLNDLRQLVNTTPLQTQAVADTEEEEEESIGALIRKHQITHLQCTPSMASLILLDEDAKTALSQVQHLMIGGEAFPVTLARELRSASQASITNMYGPTETTIWSSTQKVTGHETVISIGRPIANTQLYILDDKLNPAPIGVPGELYIGGDGVVRGYYNRPELTAERFLKNPFISDAHARIYRTGDLVRWLPDGQIDFLGRVDHQVKIRGYRIELGEIESLLAEQPSIREAIVIAREDTPGDIRLVAYVIARDGATVNPEQLKNILREALPEYMVPAHYVELQTFPYTPNKKIDRKALPAPTQTKRETPSRAITAPANDAEQIIIAIWQDVLALDYVGIEDNFFDLGGHSLLAVKAQRKLSEKFEKKIGIVDLFRYPTVKALAAYLGAEDTSGEILQKSEERALSRRERLLQRRQGRGRGGEG